MTATAITSSTIESNAYANVYSYLDNRTYVADPRNPAGTSGRKFVHTIDPFSSSLRFSDAPFIVLESPTIIYSRIGADGKHKNIGWKHNIVVRTARDGVSGSNTTGFPLGLSDMNAICDDLHTLFNSETYKAAFRLLNMYFISLIKINTGTLAIDGKIIYESQFELTYETRMAVST
jgi:hypothetical protein